MNNTINGRTPEEIKKGLKCDGTGDCTNTICPYFPEKDCLHSRHFDALAYIQQLERLEQAMFLKPLSWDEAIGDDAFLEIKDDEYIDAALNCLAFGQVDGNGKIGFVIYKTHEEDEFKLLESEYGKTWRCWARRPTDEERAAAVWEGE